MITIGKLGVELSADTIEYINGLKRAQIATETKMRKMEERYKSFSTKTTKSFTEASTKIDTGFKLQKNAAAQVGFQLQDVAVQAQAGTSAFTILAQQGSQVAAIFGPGGALFGALIAIGGAAGGVLYKALGGVTTEAMTLAEAVAKLSNNSKELARHELRQPLEEMAELLKAEEKQLKKSEAAFWSQALAVQASEMVRESYFNNRTEERKKLLDLSAALGENRRKVKELSDAMNDIGGVNKAFAKESVALSEQIYLFDASAKKVALYEAKKKGFNEVQLKAIGAYYDEIDALEKAKEAAKLKLAEDKKLAGEKKREAAKLEAMKKAAANQANQSIARSQTPAEKLQQEEAAIQDSYDKRLISHDLYIQAMNAITERGMKAETDARVRQAEDELRKKREIEDQAHQLSLTTAQSELQRIEIDSKRELQLLERKLQDGLILEKQYNDAKEELRKQTAERVIKAEQNLYQQQASIIEGVTSQALASLETFGKEGSGIYKALFLANQAAAVAQAIISAEMASANALAYLPPPYNIAMAGFVRAMGYVSAGVIAGTAIGGQFHGGTDEIPTSMNNKSFILKAGERVVQPEANKKLTKFLDSADSSSSGVVVNSKIEMGPSLVDEKTFAQALAKQADTITGLVKKTERKRPTRRSVRNA